MAKKKSRKKKIYITLALVIIAIVIVSMTFLNKGDESVKVQTSFVERRTITQSVSTIGTIQPETEVKISPETSGEIVNLPVNEGDIVKSNQLLARIRPDFIQTQLEQQQAALEASKLEIEVRKAEMDRAKSSFDRIKELFEKEFVSKQEFENAETTYNQSVSNYEASKRRFDQSLASLKQIKVSADRTTLYSPIEGIITRLNVEIGEKVLGTQQFQGTEMMVVSDLSVINAVVEVDENDIVLVEIGDTAKVEIDALPGKYFLGEVFEIGHSAIQNSLGTQDQVTNFEVKIRLLESEERLRPGMSCSAEIFTNTKYNTLAVPLQSVTIRGGNFERNPDIAKEGLQSDKPKTDFTKPPQVVFLREGNKAKMTSVETGISDKGFIEITKGLSEKQEVISGSFMAISKQLHDGAVIEIDTSFIKSRKFD